jgi:nucleoid DNA-binding protein
MNRTELAQAIALKTDAVTRAEVLEILSAMQEVVTDTLRDGETVVITGFVKFAKQDVPAKKARKGRSPFSGEEMMFKAKPATVKVRITPLKKIKDDVAAKRRTRKAIH